MMMLNIDKENPCVAALLGVAIGDAVGVPYEFRSSSELRANPCTDMVGFGTHHQPAGTWSDDSSLTFCLAESLSKGYRLEDMARQFIAWKREAWWTAHGKVFDIGRTTSQSIRELRLTLEEEGPAGLKTLKNLAKESDNGNGSLMRILPLLFAIKGQPIEMQFEQIWEVSALTHKHVRAAMACLIYLRLAECILLKIEKQQAYQQVRQEIQDFWQRMNFSKSEQVHFERCIQQDITQLKYNELKSGGYVIESIEASLWCFLNTDNYRDAILKSVNLGHDTDTTAAITGGLAGLEYGVEGIPEFWLASVALLEDIVDLGVRLSLKYT